MSCDRQGIFQAGDVILDSGFAQVLTILTGVVVAGEGLALVVGMHILSPPSNPWISLKNDLFLALDVIVGIALVIVAVTNRRMVESTMLLVLASASTIAHGYREWEYLVRAGDAFCANAPLFAVNSLKLVALLVIAIIAIRLRIASRT
jgi:hypothetical protein